MGVISEPWLLLAAVGFFFSTLVLAYTVLALRLREVQRIKQGVKESLRRSEAVVKGKVAEHFVPFLSGFDFNPRDARFLGGPIDYVVFDGLSEGDIRRVVFIEAKTGGSKLNQREKQVREAIRAGHVEWREVRHAS